MTRPSPLSSRQTWRPAWKLRKEFGDELVADLLLKAVATVEGKLALRGDLPASKTNKESK
jgi:hypothetical protein